MRYGKTFARRIIATSAMAAVACLTASWASAQCDDSCGPVCGPQYYSHPGQYGSQYGAGIHDRAKPRCIADGQCMPKRPTWGYYTQKWRRWPVTTADGAGGARRQLPPGLEKYDPPTPEQEDQKTPTPVTSAPATEGIDAPAEGEANGVPATDGLVPGLPTLPNVPQTQPNLPMPDGASSQPPMQEGDGPPALPASLWSLRRRAGREGSTPFTSPRGVVRDGPKIARLPKPRPTQTEQPHDRVRTASAVIVADGEAARNSRVLQAVHFSPVDGPSTATP